MTQPDAGNPPELSPATSIVIPAYNERRRIVPTLESIRAYAADSVERIEIIVVDDGSRDGTSDAVSTFATRAPPDEVRLLVNPVNRGKGYSVRRGVLAARGELVLMCDADLSAPIEELEELRAWLAHGYDIVIGSRDLPESVLDPPQPLSRRLMAWTFRAIRRRFLLPEIRDTQCGFKLFRASAAADVFARQTIHGWVFDCEVLGIADRLGYRIKEVGIHWRNDRHSHVRPCREALEALAALVRIRRRVGRIARRRSSA